MAHAVTFQFTPRSISNAQLKTKMERNISALLTEINRAGTAGSALNLTNISMEAGARARLEALWSDARFVCDKSSNVSNCLQDMQGYQVRQIPITMKPVDNSYQDRLNRELTLSLNRNGVITGVRLAMEKHEDVEQILQSQGGVTDLAQRREILKWVEDFRCYYNERNINALNEIFSDDALIITGSVVRRQTGLSDNAHVREDVVYNVQNKKQYIDKLRNIFRTNARVHVDFEHINLAVHGSKNNIYGVKLHQKWRTSRYSDDGWLFLLWDFQDPDHPKIHVRTWQPQEVVDRDGALGLSDFFIP